MVVVKLLNVIISIRRFFQKILLFTGGNVLITRRPLTTK